MISSHDAFCGDPDHVSAQLRQLISHYADSDLSEADADKTLETMGLDSLAAVLLARELMERFAINLHPDDLFDTSYRCILDHVQKPANKVASFEPGTNGGREGGREGARPATSASITVKETATLTPQDEDTPSLARRFPDPVHLLTQSDAIYSEAARKSGFTDYWTRVAPIEDDLVVAYITEAFVTLNVDLSQYPHGVELPSIPHLPKYDRLLKRLLAILEHRHLVILRKGKVLRGSDRIDLPTSSLICQKLRADHPQFECEVKLLSHVGPHLADCLSGKTDPISVLFGSSTSKQLMEDFYRATPMAVAHVDQLVSFVRSLVQSASIDASDWVQILEIGGGTGGSSMRLIEAIEEGNFPVRYTFTDIGSSFVNRAKARWSNKPWMQFAVLDIEDEMPQSFRGRYDLIVGSNVVHATKDRIASCRRLKDALRPGGLLLLSEVTHVIHWYDICFGLLDGWWLAQGAKDYAIQPAAVWAEVFCKAGLEHAGHSRGDDSEEAWTQQILVARKIHHG